MRSPPCIHWHGGRGRGGRILGTRTPLNGLLSGGVQLDVPRRCRVVGRQFSRGLSRAAHNWSVIQFFLLSIFLSKPLCTASAFLHENIDSYTSVSCAYPLLDLRFWNVFRWRPRSFGDITTLRGGTLLWNWRWSWNAFSCLVQLGHKGSLCNTGGQRYYRNCAGNRHGTFSLNYDESISDSTWTCVPK